jgi:hypothetical protein
MAPQKRKTMIYKTKHRKLKILSNTNPTKTGDELRCSGRIGSSCSTSGTRRITLVNTLRRERGNEDIAVTTTDGTYSWPSVFMMATIKLSK